MTYTFRNRFKIGGNRYAVDGHEYVLAEPPSDDGRVVLKSGSGQAISQTDELILQGSGYPDFDAAKDAGRRWRQYLTKALPRDGRGADFGDDGASRIAPVLDCVFEEEPPEIFAMMGIERGDRIVQDRQGLIVFATEPPAKCLHAAAGAVTIGTGVGTSLKTAHESTYAPFDARQELAYALVHQALFDPNPETRYIQLVTAIEALLPEAACPRLIQDALDELVKVAKEWPESETKTRVLQILDGDRRESVRQMAMGSVSKLSSTYDDLQPKSYFDLCYGNRSALVHGNAERPDVREYRTLLRFVLDVLDVYANND